MSQICYTTTFNFALFCFRNSVFFHDCNHCRLINYMLQVSLLFCYLQLLFQEKHQINTRGLNDQAVETLLTLTAVV